MPIPFAPDAGDPVPVVRAGLSGRAEALRSVATRATLLAGSLGWHSAGAAEFDARVAALADALRRAADQLDTVNELLARADAAGPHSDRTAIAQ